MEDMVAPGMRVRRRGEPVVAGPFLDQRVQLADQLLVRDGLKRSHSLPYSCQVSSDRLLAGLDHRCEARRPAPRGATERIVSKGVSQELEAHVPRGGEQSMGDV